MTCGKRERTGRQFLESMTTIDEMANHDDNCGHCGRMRVDSEAAREILAARPEGDIPMAEAATLWCDLAQKKWEDTKYWKLWQEETAAGRDPHEAFAQRGWEP